MEKREITLKRLKIMCTANLLMVTMTGRYRMALIAKWKLTTISRQNILLKKTNSAQIEENKSGSDSRASVCNAGDPNSILGSGRFPGEGKDNPLQYSCLENPIDRGAW